LSVPVLISLPPIAQRFYNYVNRPNGHGIPITLKSRGAALAITPGLDIAGVPKIGPSTGWPQAATATINAIAYLVTPESVSRLGEEFRALPQGTVGQRLLDAYLALVPGGVTYGPTFYPVNELDVITFSGDDYEIQFVNPLISQIEVVAKRNVQ
jgi:hypothetical protein